MGYPFHLAGVGQAVLDRPVSHATKPMPTYLNRIVPVLAVAAYLAATALPCPISTESSAAPVGAIAYSHSAHDHDDSSVGPTPGQASSVPFFSEPCPCGCEGKTGGNLATKRLGRLIPPESQVFAIARAPAAQTFLLQPMPSFALSPPEQIPILS